MDSTYWNDRYAANDTNWDKGTVAPPIARLLREVKLPPNARVGSLGAGPGHEAIEAARLGFRAAAIDFAPLACQQTAKNAAAAAQNVAVLEADLFTLFKRRPRHYDALIEHTCFCAIPVERRDEYVTAVHGLLIPQGLLLGLFYAHGREGGPPFDVQESEIRRRFEPLFFIDRLTRAPDSFEQRKDLELEFVFRAR